MLGELTFSVKLVNDLTTPNFLISAFASDKFHVETALAKDVKLALFLSGQNFVILPFLLMLSDCPWKVFDLPIFDDFFEFL